MPTIVYVTCKDCRSIVDTYIADVSSGLGPPLCACRKCGQPVPTPRVEWPDMSVFYRVRYAALSLVYAVIFGFLTGGLGCAVVDFYTKGPFRWETRPDFQFFFPIAIVAAFSLL